jgi:hypothetical protein
MKKIFLLFIISLTNHSAFCQDITNNETEKKNLVLKLSHISNDCKDNKHINFKTFKIKKGWGFDILVNDKIFIHQPSIPAINGNLPFKTKRDAKKIAKLMIFKICNDITPPSITLEEINNLIDID